MAPLSQTGLQQYPINLENIEALNTHSQQSQNTPLLQQYPNIHPNAGDQNSQPGTMVPGLVNMSNVGSVLSSQYPQSVGASASSDIPIAIHSVHNINQQQQITGYLPNTIMSTHAQHGVTNAGIIHSPMTSTNQQGMSLSQNDSKSNIPAFQSQR